MNGKMSLRAEKTLRIGQVAQLTATTPRTIRYYEEIGLLPGSQARSQGQHRCYTQDDVERIREIVRLRDLLGVSLEQLRALLEAESARAELRREYERADSASRRRRILSEALDHISTQLELVRRRRAELEQLEAQLEEKRRTVIERLGELEAAPAAASFGTSG